jgi:large subunit ribosomal protein L31
MKKELHPDNYRPVVFQDLNDDTAFLTRSTVATEETIKWEDGNEYPLIRVHISSASHPFFTGQEKMIDIEGRVDKFKARTAAAAKKREEAAGRKQKTRAKKTTATQKVGAGKAPRPAAEAKPADTTPEPADEKPADE